MPGDVTTEGQACAVSNCDYVVEALIEDFPVCALHDDWRTYVILENLELPHAGWSQGKPIVFRAGVALAIEHFEPRKSRCGVKAFDDPRMLEVPTKPTHLVHPNQDLTVG